MNTTIAPTAVPTGRRTDTTVSSAAPGWPVHLHAALLVEAEKRSEQLDQLAPGHRDDLGRALLAAAQRTMVEVRAALDRWAEGSYGLCLTCSNAIPVARLELRPWASHCVDCARR